MFVFGLFQSKKEANIGIDDVVTVAKNSQLKATQDKISNMKNSIVLNNLEPLSQITSSSTITGKAVGSWYSSGNFDILILDESGHQLATSTAVAQSEWLTTDFVNFKADIKLSTKTNNAQKTIGASTVKATSATTTTTAINMTQTTTATSTLIVLVFKGANQETMEFPLILTSVIE
jgi:hypothetical protein